MEYKGFKIYKYSTSDWYAVVEEYDWLSGEDKVLYRCKSVEKCKKWIDALQFVKKRFKIICTETHIYEFYVDAENKIEAQKKYEQGEFDSSYGYVESSTYKVEEE